MEGERQFILEIVGRQKKDEHGNPVWTDKDNGIGRCDGRLRRVEVLVPADSDSGYSYHVITISRSDLFAVMKKVEEEEAKEFDEFID